MFGMNATILEPHETLYVLVSENSKHAVILSSGSLAKEGNDTMTPVSERL